MFHKKNLFAVVTALLFFSLIYERLNAASRNISSLKLDFLRTERAVQNNQAEASSIGGTIIYNKNPYLFIFQITSPVKQTMFVNQDGAFILDNETVYEISGNEDFLRQTCNDFLNWFKSDYGLADSFFTPTTRVFENDAIVTQWDCYKPEDQPLDKILVYSDSFGRFTRLQMFAELTTLVTDTTLSGFEASSGFFYPTSIVSVSYDEEQPVIKTELLLSNISFSIPYDNEYKELTFLLKDENTYVQDTPVSKNLSVAQQFTKPVTPAQATYTVSIPSVLINGSYKFYKKFITAQDMSNCPFYPTCSQFMMDAISKNGAFGFFQGVERLRRCTSTEHKRDQYPTLSNGKHYDPVPAIQKK